MQRQRKGEMRKKGEEERDGDGGKGKKKGTKEHPLKSELQLGNSDELQ